MVCAIRIFCLKILRMGSHRLTKNAYLGLYNIQRKRGDYVKKTEQTTTLLPNYGKRKLLTYADSFRDLAKTFVYIPKEETEVKEEIDRQNYLVQKRLMENRELLADHLNEMAGIMTQVAEESYRFTQPGGKQKKQLTHALKQHHIYIDDIYIIENKNQHMEITANMKAIKPTTFSVEEIAGLLSVVFNKRLLPVIGSISYLQKELQTVVFEEESRFGILTGVARAIKENEKISGDNYSFIQIGNGNLVGSISDGMGTGEKACSDSAEVIDLLEKLLEAGFSKEAAVQIINGVLIAGSEQQNMSTLDVCDINLYSGVCEFLKIGSAVTYLKRGATVEQITSSTLPLGVFSQLDIDPIRKRLIDGDYIIMITDGIIDSIPMEGNTELFKDVISKTNIQNPKEIANHILKFAIHAGKGKIKDDMMVLVIGIWENNK